MPSIQLHSMVTDGRLEFKHAEAIRVALSQFNGKMVSVVIKPFKLSASDPQRRYWFKVVVPAVADVAGYTLDEAHDQLLYHLMPEKRKETKRIDGTIKVDRCSWNDLDTGDVVELFERAYRFAAEFYELYIPNPNGMM